MTRAYICRHALKNSIIFGIGSVKLELGLVGLNSNHGQILPDENQSGLKFGC